MSVAENAAQQIAATMDRRASVQTYSINPALIAILMQLFQTLMDGCMKKQAPTVGCDNCRKPGIFQRAALKHYIKQTISSGPRNSRDERQEFRAKVDEIYDACLEYGREMTPEVFAQIQDELA